MNATIREVQPASNLNREPGRDSVEPLPGIALEDVPESRDSACQRYVYWSFVLVAVVPRGVVTVMSTVPVPGGEVAMMILGETCLMLVAALGPKSTAVAPARV